MSVLKVAEVHCEMVCGTAQCSPSLLVSVLWSGKCVLASSVTLARDKKGDTLGGGWVDGERRRGSGWWPTWTRMTSTTSLATTSALSLTRTMMILMKEDRYRTQPSCVVCSLHPCVLHWTVWHQWARVECACVRVCVCTHVRQNELYGSSLCTGSPRYPLHPHRLHATAVRCCHDSRVLQQETLPMLSTLQCNVNSTHHCHDLSLLPTRTVWYGHARRRRNQRRWRQMMRRRSPMTLPRRSSSKEWELSCCMRTRNITLPPRRYGQKPYAGMASCCVAASVVALHVVGEARWVDVACSRL